MNTISKTFDKSVKHPIKIIITCALFLMLIFSNTAYGQVLSLSQIIDLSNCKKLSEFDTKVRTLGYSYNMSKKQDEEITKYYYQKNNADIYLIYWDGKDGSPMVEFRITSKVSANFINDIKSQFVTFSFEETKNSPEIVDGALIFHYENSKYDLTILDSKEDGYNLYSIYVSHSGKK